MTDPGVLTIKYYGNRRAFHCRQYGYMNLDQIFKVFKGGRDVRIVDREGNEIVTETDPKTGATAEVNLTYKYLLGGLKKRQERAYPDTPNVTRAIRIGGIQPLVEQVEKAVKTE